MVLCCFRIAYNQSIVKAEYFIDKDPGVGNADSISIGGAKDTLNIQFDIDISSLSTGWHFLHVRLLDSGKLWSPWQLQMFYVDDTLDIGKINEAEYFINKDPGVGNGISLSFSPADSVVSNINLSTAGLNQGWNFFHFRSKIEEGLWSPWQLQMFYVDDTLDIGKINEAEYFINKDPGVGSGTPLSFSVADTIISNINVSTSDLEKGWHFFHFRSKIEEGLWSPWQLQMFYVDDTLISPKITSFSTAIDSSLLNPNVATKFPLSPPADTLHLVHIETTDTLLTFGDHVLRIWAEQEGGLKSTWHFDTFTVIDCPMLDTADFVGPSDICLGDTVIFVQDILKFGVWGIDSFNFTWKIDTAVHSTSDSLTYHFTKSGQFQIELSFTRKGDSRCRGNFDKKITVHTLFNDTTELKVCAGDSLIIHGNYESSEGLYTNFGSSQFGCDSIHVISLIHLPIYDDTLIFNICQGDSILVHGVFVSTSGTYTADSLVSSTGCDSLSTRIIHVRPTFNSKDTFFICEGDTLTIHGKEYFVGGTFVDSFISQFGCDSIYITHIEINPTYRYFDTIKICQGDTFFAHSKMYHIGGNYTDSFLTTNSCDSIFNTTIIVSPTFFIADTFSICGNEQIVLHGKTYTQSGTYLDSFKTLQYCDSIHLTYLIVHPSYSSVDSFVLCQGDTLKVHSQEYTTANTYLDSFVTINGCDSVFASRLIFNPTYNITIDRGLCGGDSIFFAGTYRASTGVYFGNFLTNKGCDSSVTLNLTVDSFIVYNQNKEICLGDSIFLEGAYRKISGVYRDDFIADKGCDSIVFTTLFINRPDTTHLLDTICFGTSLHFHGALLNTSGTFNHILKNRKGCDSLLILHLFQRTRNEFNRFDTLCYGDSLFTGNSFKYSNGSYIDTLLNRFGCDSFLTTHIIVRDIDSGSISVHTCSGDSINIGSGFKSKEGFYTDILANRFGCDSVVNITLNHFPTHFVSLFDTFCRGTTRQFFNQTLVHSGIYTHILQNQFGCDSTIEMNLISLPQVIPKVISVGFNQLSTDTVYQSYQWYLDRNILKGDTQQTIFVSRPGIYDVSITTSKGCVNNSWDLFTGINGPEKRGFIQVYPNPTSHILTINVSDSAKMKVFNQMGQIVLNSDLTQNNNQIDVSILADGLYYVNVFGEYFYGYYKIIIAR